MTIPAGPLSAPAVVNRIAADPGQAARAIGAGQRILHDAGRFRGHLETYGIQPDATRIDYYRRLWTAPESGDG